jgi:hypothetical protein
MSARKELEPRLGRGFVVCYREKLGALHASRRVGIAKTSFKNFDFRTDTKLSLPHFL